jgi:phospholipid/cholesterol/gamma-HCH transport system substrate-binding protein
MSARRARGLARLAIGSTVLAVVVVLFVDSRYGIIFGHTGSYPHYLQTTVPSAFEAIPGERVVAGGVTVGEITQADVTSRGKAHLVMGIDDTEWPIPTDSTLTLRMGGTIKYTDRFISIAKGRSGTYFADDASVPAGQFIVPVEFEQLFNIFNAKTRQNMQSFFANAGPTLESAAHPFQRALPLAGSVLNQAAAVFNDVGYDQQAFSTLVSSTAEISDALQSANPTLQTLIQEAANTFSAVGAGAQSVKRLIAAGAYFSHWGDVSLPLLGSSGPSIFVKLGRLARLLNPGVTQLNRMAGPLNETLSELQRIEPTAVQTLNTVRRYGPNIDGLLSSARTKLLPQLASVSTQAAKEVGCIRPYTPDILGFLQGWGGFLGVGENTPHINFLHAYLSILPLPNATPITSGQASKLLPNLGIDFPQVPGSSWNQPWYQPQCGVTANSYTAATDPESHTYDPNAGKLVPYS